MTHQNLTKQTDTEDVVFDVGNLERKEKVGMTHKEGWDRIFDERFLTRSGSGMLRRAQHIETPDKLKKFIHERESTLLSSLLSLIEKMRKEPTLCGECNLVGDLCRTCYANRWTNKALDDLSSQIKRLY